MDSMLYRIRYDDRMKQDDHDRLGVQLHDYFRHRHNNQQYSPNPDDVSAEILLQLIARTSSLTLVFSALISEFVLAISKSNSPVIFFVLVVAALDVRSSAGR